jgi:H+-transporting ATPase
MAVYGFHIMTPIGWSWAGFVWGYALIWALLTDPLKLLAYRIFDHVQPPVTPKKPLDRPQKAAPVPS